MTLSWLDVILHRGGPPSMAALMWRVYRCDILWCARVIVVGTAFGIGCGAILVGVRDMLGQESPSSAQLAERIQSLNERTQDHEARLRMREEVAVELLIRMARVEQISTENAANVQLVTKLSIASLLGMLAFLAKELLRLIQERRQ